MAEVLLALLDRWAVHTKPRHESQQLVPQPQDCMFMNNWSTGLGAKIALDIHRTRQSDLAAFNSRSTNKVQHVKFVTLDFISLNTMLLAGRTEFFGSRNNLG